MSLKRTGEKPSNYAINTDYAILFVRGTGTFQKDIARMIGVDERTIVNWAKGRKKPKEKNLEKLRAILEA